MSNNDSDSQNLGRGSKTKAKADDPLAGALRWDWGTAYEMLLSLDTLFRPKVHGVPAPWAAGVRKRLTPQSQAALKGFIAPNFGVYTYVPLPLRHDSSKHPAAAAPSPQHKGPQPPRAKLAQ